MAENEELTIESPEVKAALDMYNDMREAGQSDTIMDTNQKTGVIMTLISAVLSDEKFQYRQTLRTASFADSRQSAKAAAAISEAERYGAPISLIVNMIEAQNGERGPAGVRGQALEALTHFTLGTNNFYNKKNGGNGHDKSKPI